MKQYLQCGKSKSDEGVIITEVNIGTIMSNL